MQQGLPAKALRLSSNNGSGLNSENSSIIIAVVCLEQGDVSCSLPICCVVAEVKVLLLWHRALPGSLAHADTRAALPAATSRLDGFIVAALHRPTCGVQLGDSACMRGKGPPFRMHADDRGCVVESTEEAGSPRPAPTMTAFLC